MNDLGSTEERWPSPDAVHRRAVVHVVFHCTDAPPDIDAFCRSVRAMLDRLGARSLVCDMGQVTRPDTRTIDAVARLQLMVRRRGGAAWLEHASSELAELLELVGLADVVPVRDDSGVEVRRQPEEWEEASGVEEESDPADPPA